MNDELRFDPDGYVAMDQFTGDDPDDALPAAVGDELHALLQAAPAPLIEDATWADLLDVALHETAVVDVDDLVAAPNHVVMTDDATEGARDDDGFGAWADLDDGVGGDFAGAGPDDDPFEIADDDGYDTDGFTSEE